MAEYLDPRLAALQSELTRDRERYNALYALTRRARPRLESERFCFNLTEYLGPLVVALPLQERDRLVAELYPVVLELSGVELFERSLAVRELWREYLPQGLSLFAQDPARVAASLTNAVYNLEREAGVDWRFWLRQTTELAPGCHTVDEWLSLGQVLSWVSGMAHYRESALALAEKLPAHLLEQAVPRWDQLRQDPWWSRRPASGRLATVHKIGAFVGFGGLFRQPPEVMSVEHGRFLVSDRFGDWLLFSDGFGATLKSVLDWSLPETVPTKEARIHSDCRVEWQGEMLAFPELGPILSAEVSGDVLAVTGRLSHAIHLVLRTPS